MTTQAIADETVAVDPPAAPVTRAPEAPQAAPAPTLRQRLQYGHYGSLTTTATSLENAKTGKADADSRNGSGPRSGYSGEHRRVAERPNRILSPPPTA